MNIITRKLRTLLPITATLLLLGYTTGSEALSFQWQWSRWTSNDQPVLAEPLLNNIDAQGPRELTDSLDEHTVRRTITQVNLSAVTGSDPATGNSVIQLNLFPTVSIRATMTRFENRSTVDYSWFGAVDGEPDSTVVLSVTNNKLAGLVTYGGKLFRIRALASGNYNVSQIDRNSFPPEAEIENPPDIAYLSGVADSSQRYVIDSVIDTTDAPDTLCRTDIPGDSCGISIPHDDGSTIDILVAYTAAARDKVGDIISEIQLAVDVTNQSFALSNINPRLRLVGTRLVNHTETGDLDTDLSRLRDNLDGFMDAIHQARNDKAADIVSLLIENDGGSCGLGYIMSTVALDFENRAFNVVDVDCAVNNYTFAHELGHNMGAQHDAYEVASSGSLNKPAYPYGYGYANPDAGFRTIMAYRTLCEANGMNCQRELRWSNPDQYIGADPLGIAVDSDGNGTNNRKTLNQTAFVVSNFRVSPENAADTEETSEDSSDTPTYSYAGSLSGSSQNTQLYQF
jgi:hypothetical protein